MELKIGKTKIKIIKGDITEQTIEAIVNAANSSLMGGGGVDGAIHRKGGLRILEDCKRIRKSQWPKGLPTGEAVITTGGNLKAKHVIHTVGPIWRGGKFGEPELLEEAYRNSLKLAVSKGLRSIAFPAISTGAYSYPLESAAKITLKSLETFLKKEDNLEEVVLVLFSEKTYITYKETVKKLFNS